VRVEVKQPVFLRADQVQRRAGFASEHAEALLHAERRRDGWDVPLVDEAVDAEHEGNQDQRRNPVAFGVFC
jgi:hypothetical protein